MKQIDFKATDTGPKRANQLYSLCEGVCDHERRIGKVETTVDGISPSGVPGDPGDMTLWFENALV